MTTFCAVTTNSCRIGDKVYSRGTVLTLEPRDYTQGLIDNGLLVRLRQAEDGWLVPTAEREYFGPERTGLVVEPCLPVKEDGET